MTFKTLISALRTAQSDDESGLFAFYERLLRLRERQKSAITSIADGERVSSTPGQPLLRWEDLGIMETSFSHFLTSVAELWEIRDPGALDELQAFTDAERLAAAAEWYRK